MKIITLSKALLFWLIIGHNTSVLCAGETGKPAPQTAGGTAGRAAGGTAGGGAGGAASANTSEGKAKGNDDGRRAITLELNNKSSNQYSYNKTGNIEKFTVYQGFKIQAVTKGGVNVWTPKKAGRFAKEISVNTSTNKLTALYLESSEPV